jgi:hypothetical protein
MSGIRNEKFVNNYEMTFPKICEFKTQEIDLISEVKKLQTWIMNWLHIEYSICEMYCGIQINIEI